jgi:hypothetical protein
MSKELRTWFENPVMTDSQERKRYFIEEVIPDRVRPSFDLDSCIPDIEKQEFNNPNENMNCYLPEFYFGKHNKTASFLTSIQSWKEYISNYLCKIDVKEKVKTFSTEAMHRVYAAPKQFSSYFDNNINTEVDVNGQNSQTINVLNLKAEISVEGDIYTLYAIINKLITNSRFYGAGILIDKVFYNLLSYNFIYSQMLQEMMKDTSKTYKLVIYTYGDNVQEEVIEANIANNKSTFENIVKDLLAFHPIGFIEKDNENENEENKLIGEFLCNIFEDDLDGTIHLSDYQHKIKLYDTDANLNDEDFIKKFGILEYGNFSKIDFNLKGTSAMTSQALEEKNWCVNLDRIDLGIVIPAYGLIKKQGSFIIQHSGLRHPNVSTSGTNYCTGSANKYSYQGIGELSYGNLTSPMNTSIVHNNVFAHVKAWQFAMLEHAKMKGVINA